MEILLFCLVAKDHFDCSNDSRRNWVVSFERSAPGEAKIF